MLINLLKYHTNKPIPVLDKALPFTSYIPIDLSVSNSLLNSFDTTSSNAWEVYISQYLNKHHASVAYGGYLEQRNLYQRSVYFSGSDRDMHLGIDLWCNAGTKVLAVFDGEIHSFQNNSGVADYGPTIILKHELQQFAFYSLYGHLSPISLEGLKVGQLVRQGQPIGTLGTAAVNGDYAPHLHFQLMLDMQGNLGDYPGVCSKKDLDFFKANCPDPNLLLKLG